MKTEKYSFQFNQFEKNWQEFQNEKSFCDVTLSCEDKLVLTHKIILSSSSPVFKNLLQEHSNQYPLIYITGVKYTNLQNLLSFKYKGEVNFDKEDIESFLEVAEDLKIRGLYEENGLSLNTKFSIEDINSITQDNATKTDIISS